MPVTIDPTKVYKDYGALEITRAAYETINAGQICKRELGTGKIELSTNATKIGAESIGIAVNSAMPGNPVSVAYTGEVVISDVDVLTPGHIYCVGIDGGLVDSSELTAGQFVTVVGIAISTKAIKLYPSIHSGVEYVV